MTTTQIPSRRIFNPAQKDAVTFLETAAESGGARTLIEVEVAPGGGTEPHVHHSYAEAFEVLDGTLTVQVGDTFLPLGPGESASAPAGTKHCFRNRTQDIVVFRVEIVPGQEGFERALRVAYGLAGDRRVLKDGTPRNPLHLGLLVVWSDSALCGPLGVLMPVFRILARVARRRGIERALIERYCA